MEVRLLVMLIDCKDSCEVSKWEGVYIGYSSDSAPTVKASTYCCRQFIGFHHSRLRVDKADILRVEDSGGRWSEIEVRNPISTLTLSPPQYLELLYEVVTVLPV